MSRLTELEKLFGDFRIVTQDGITAYGSLRTGYAVDTSRLPGANVTTGTSGFNPPPPATGACCIGDACSITTATLCALSGGDYQGDNTTCSPNPCPTTTPTGACCADNGACSITTADDCTGTYQGDDTTCDPNPCPQPPPPTGACCVDGECSITTEAGCTGTYQGDDTTCDPNPCGAAPTTGACCNNGDCSILTNAACLASGGVYEGDGTTCTPNPCDLPSCECGFDAFDGSGGTFLSSFQSWEDHYHFPDCVTHDDSPKTRECTTTVSQTFDGITCTESPDEEGTCHAVLCDGTILDFGFSHSFIQPSDFGVVVVSPTYLTLDLNVGCPPPCVEIHAYRILTDECGLGGFVPPP